MHTNVGSLPQREHHDWRANSPPQYSVSSMSRTLTPTFHTTRIAAFHIQGDSTQNTHAKHGRQLGSRPVTQQSQQAAHALHSPLQPNLGILLFISLKVCIPSLIYKWRRCRCRRAPVTPCVDVADSVSVITDWTSTIGHTWRDVHTNLQSPIHRHGLLRNTATWRAPTYIHRFTAMDCCATQPRDVHINSHSSIHRHKLLRNTATWRHLAEILGTQFVNAGMQEYERRPWTQ